jgi:hypothetical protein
MRTTKRAQLANVAYVGISKKVDNNTVAYTRPNGDRCIRLHRTDVVTHRADGCCVLNSGGWQTVTTKDRINSYGPAGVRVFQRKHEWFICKAGDWDNAVPFEDGVVITPGGELLFPSQHAEAAQ